MDKNVGRIDARIRIAIGVVVAIFTILSVVGFLTLPFVSEFGGAIIAAVLIVEGTMRRCLLYRLLGIDRCPIDWSCCKVL